VNLALYMDVHAPRAIVVELRIRGVDVITAQEDGSDQRPDEWLLERAGSLDRILFSQDADLLRIACDFQGRGREFAGLVYTHQLRLSLGRIIDDLEIIAKTGEKKDFRNRVEFLPLR
jgi:hypothetical protein